MAWQDHFVLSAYLKKRFISSAEVFEIILYENSDSNYCAIGLSFVEELQRRKVFNFKTILWHDH